MRAYRERDHEEAFGWILAGQCHDREARELLVRNAADVLQYVMEKYGDSTPQGRRSGAIRWLAGRIG